ncbi:MAG: 3-deoxy-manno-octulosonate cytidylyltransferase [Flavobacteriaceae bacterium]|nr:3-deoxy-manno-octulosonate cytidylyltransferase [Flavobacteriaceae bacterium]MBL6681292.1 3-deoxy-manno-octulosonate cytidylyltransferase [Flavobacteriaceae bacterium]
MRSIALIPARLESTRLNRKLLRELNGIPLIVRTAQNITDFKIFDEVHVITDSIDIKNILDKYSISNFLSEKDHQTGTDRVAEYANNFDCDIIINVQGDEPFIKKENLQIILSEFKNDHNKIIDVISLKKRIDKQIDVDNHNNVKVVTDANDFANFFSRSPIPHNRSNSFNQYYKHIGVYAFRKKALMEFPKMFISEIEKAEKIEALRFIYNDKKIKLLEIHNNIISIDTEEDFIEAEKFIHD